MDRQPASVRTIRRVYHTLDNDIPEPEPGVELQAVHDQMIESIEYTDGFGRLLQARAQAEDVTFGDVHFGNAVLPIAQDDETATTEAIVGRARGVSAPDNVVVSSWKTYDNKGRVVEAYEPFYATGWNHAAPGEAQRGQKATFYRDPRGQVVRSVNPNGSEQRVALRCAGGSQQSDNYAPTPWETYTYDANDLAPLSTLSIGGGGDAQVPVSHHFTPSSIVIDALGRTVRGVERNGPDPDTDGIRRCRPMISAAIS